MDLIYGATISGANESGSTLVVSDTAADTLNVGDKFSIANVNSVNSTTRRKGSLGGQVFTVRAPVTDTIQISPPIYGPGSQYLWDTICGRLKCAVCVAGAPNTFADRGGDFGMAGWESDDCDLITACGWIVGGSRVTFGKRSRATKAIG